jgi:hypothetical protein
MNEDELRAAVESVRNSIEKSHLRWVLREVDETLRLGKPALRTVLEVDEESPEMVHLPAVTVTGRRPRKQVRRSTTVPTTDAYSPREELVLLLDAIQRTAIATAEMRSYVTEKIARYGGLVSPERKITFERDGRPSSTIQYEDQPAGKAPIAELGEAIRSLRERAQ